LVATAALLAPLPTDRFYHTGWSPTRFVDRFRGR
jgi:hypothetical protein